MTQSAVILLLYGKSAIVSVTSPVARMAAGGWKRGGDFRDIPTPSGPHVVGCVDLMHKLPVDEDGLLVRLFYPSEGGAAGCEYARCVPDKRYADAQMKITAVGCPPFQKILDRTPNNEPDPKCPALVEAPLLKLSAANQTFPVIVFSHGLSSMRTGYTAICCDLASHGYVVAAVEHRDGSACLSLRRVPKPGGAPEELQDAWLQYDLKDFTDFPLRNRQVKQRACEVGKSLDLLGLLNDGVVMQNMMDVKFDFRQFRGRLDLNTAAVMGHSYGGVTTVQTLLDDQRFKCGIALDAWLFPIHEDTLPAGGISKPLLFINSHLEFQWKRNVQKMLQLVKEPDERGISTCQILTIKDTDHVHQSDNHFVWPRLIRDFLWRAPIDPTLAHTVNMELCHSFLRRFLLLDPAYQAPVPNLDKVAGRSEHVIVVDVNDLPAEQPRPQFMEDGDNSLN